MTGAPTAAARRRIARRLENATGQLGSAAMARMERDKAWFRDLPPEARSWIGLVVQAGISSFIQWFADPEGQEPVASEIFEAAPRAMAGVVNLQQTVELVRLTISVVEENAGSTVGEDDAHAVRDAILQYGREVAFATAEVYARTAEVRGAWDARLEALLVDSVMRSDDEEAIKSRASALGWAPQGAVCAVVGDLHDSGDSATLVIEAVRRAAHHAGFPVACAVQGDWLVVLLGGVEDPLQAGETMGSHFPGEHVVVGTPAPDIVQAQRSTREAISGLRAVSGWRSAPRVVLSEDLLPERLLNGDRDAADQLIEEVYVPLAKAGGHTLETVETYLDNARNLEATSRALFVHPNTVRYRLRGATELTGLDASHPRQGHTMRLAITLGRLFRPEVMDL